MTYPPKPIFTDPTPDDVAELAARIRPADAQEIALTAPGFTPSQAVALSVRLSDVSIAGRIEGDLIAIGGIRAESLIQQTATVWLLATDYADRHPRQFARWSRPALRTISDALPWAEHLHNHVWADHHQAVRWLSFLGASFSSAVNGPTGAAFFPFTIERSLICACK
jgi:hypothetical protein